MEVIDKFVIEMSDIGGNLAEETSMEPSFVDYLDLGDWFLTSTLFLK